MSHDNGEEAGQDDISPPLLHPQTNSQLGSFSLSLFDNILTPPPCNLQHGHLLLDVGQITNIYNHIYKGILEGVIR